MTSEPTPVRARGTNPHTVARFVAVALVYPAIITIVAVTVQLIALPRVPATIATHWEGSGTADGFAPAWFTPLMTAVLAFGLPALLALTALPGLRRGDRGASYRFIGASSAGTASLLVCLLTWSFVIQIDVADPATVVLPVWPTMFVLFAVAIGVGVAGWFAQPAGVPDARGVTSAEPLDIGVSERAVWMRTVSIARPGLIVITLAAIVLTGVAIGAWVAGAPPVTAWVLTGSALLIVGLAATTTCFHVRVDDGGLSVESVLGVPRFRVPLAAVEQVAVVPVNPMGEFGGWGLRFGMDGRFGVVLRTGDAIEVTRRGKRPLVVTVDDAATGASLLQGLALRAGGGGS